MCRDVRRLSDAAFDLVVVGGGIHGACVAWDATLRGLRVALVERDDFGGATSANSLRIVHGGLRYLARANLRRMRESILERSALLRIAPTLVELLPVLVPTTGAGTQSRRALGAAIFLNDLLSLGRNRGLGVEHRLPRGRLVSLGECRALFPAFPADGATGGALWYDARMRHPERLTLAFVRAAVQHGATVANYCRMERILETNGRRLHGIAVTDLLGGAAVEIRARAVVVCAGPWTGPLVGAERGRPHAFALNLAIGRRLTEAAVGVRARTGAAEDPIIGGHRFVFLVPQDSGTLVGTWYAPAAGRRPDDLVRQGTAALLSELRAACPALEVADSEILQSQWGWLPLKAGLEPGRADALADRPRIVDHRANGGLTGLFSVEGVKYTTARAVAEAVVDRVVTVLGAAAGRCRTADTRVDEHEAAADPSLEGRIRRAVREEMAVHLSDVLLRRVGSGAPPDPGPDATDFMVATARIAGTELGWSAARQEMEIVDLMGQIQATGSSVEPLA